MNRMSKIEFLGDSLEVIKEFPESAKRLAGYNLHLVQSGQVPTNWKPMKTVGQGVREIIINEDGAYRVFYVTNIGDRVVVLHAFQKKTQKTRKQDIELGRKRFKELHR